MRVLPGDLLGVIVTHSLHVRVDDGYAVLWETLKGRELFVIVSKPWFADGAQWIDVLTRFGLARVPEDRLDWACYRS